jgi:hypothetical protein
LLDCRLTYATPATSDCAASVAAGVLAGSRNGKAAG